MRIVPDTSPFRRIPLNMDGYQATFLVAIRWNIEMLNYHYTLLLNAIDRLADQEGELDIVGVEALSNAWSFLDSSWRFRELIEQMPNLKRTPVVKVFLRKTESMGKLRNSIQHLRREITTLVANGQSAWGILTWLKMQDPNGRMLKSCALVVGGSRSDNREIFPVPVGGTMHATIDKVTLTHSGTSVDLSEIGRRIAKVFKGLEGGLATELDSLNLPEAPHQGSMQLLILDLEPDWG